MRRQARNSVSEPQMRRVHQSGGEQMFGTRWFNASVLWVALTAITAGQSSAAWATPPEYKSFDRAQAIAPTIASRDVLRVWIIYVGQGDAILIQLPERFAYITEGRKERIDVLVDGGPSGSQLRVFLDQLYPDGARIESVVLTHHDTDHVQGLTTLLHDDRFEIQRIYHNGLASWRQGKHGFPKEGWPSPSKAVFVRNPPRGLGFVEEGSDELKPKDLISDLPSLKKANHNTELVSVYGAFATAVTQKTRPAPVRAFQRSYANSPFIAPQESAGSPRDVHFEPLWPRERPRRYDDWGYSVNGNSVTFLLTYDEFSMLFTGDQNEVSERDMLAVLKDKGELARLSADVLKVPHHGSQHNAKEFFDAVAPVVSVDSMGSKGFGAKWKHPSLNVIRWLGGPHRVYHTHIHERAFDYDHLDPLTRGEMVEKKHVLIETDGRWFRVVEVDDPRNIPSVEQVKRGNGTRWISAQR